MYRVELKALNEPMFATTISHFVPNVPCGVESCSLVALTPNPPWFLMYRVELKDIDSENALAINVCVPNVPCGVESFVYKEQERFCLTDCS